VARRNAAAAAVVMVTLGLEDKDDATALALFVNTWLILTANVFKSTGPVKGEEGGFRSKQD
jgi:hypothetical protein